MSKKTVDDKGYTVLDTVDIIKQRELPNSDPAPGDNFTYQEQPWDKREQKRHEG
jgi:hypothetical protein